MRSTLHSQQQHDPRQASLPLFGQPDAEPGQSTGAEPGPTMGGAMARDGAIVEAAGEVKFGEASRQKPSSGPELVNRHLKAARALSRKMRRIPDRSPEQTMAGRAICQHLRAFLREAQAEQEARESRTPH